MPSLPSSVMPSDLSHALIELGVKWATSPERPRVVTAINEHWDTLINEWASSDLPLVIRKQSGTRGAVVVHETGRELIIADNSPAQWAFSRAYQDHAYTIADIREQLAHDEIPFTMVTSTVDKALQRYHRTLQQHDNVNKRGWKLCHVDEVSPRKKQSLSTAPIESLKVQFRNLMRPGNHFLIPLAWGGLGEVSEIIEAIREYERPAPPPDEAGATHPRALGHTQP